MTTPAPDLRHAWTLPDRVDGAWAARRRLAEALRVLTERCVRADDADALHEVAEEAERLARRLPQGDTAADAFAAGAYLDDPRVWVDRGALAGRSNPLAPPLHVHWRDDAARAEVVLGEPYVGAPGMVHGGVIAACFDQVCGHCVTMHGIPALTRHLQVWYRRPTHLGVPLRFEARLVARGEQEAKVHGVCLGRGGATAEAEATFAVVDAERARALFAGRS